MENHNHELKTSSSEAKAPPEPLPPIDVRKKSKHNPMAARVLGSSDFSSLHQAKPLVQARSLVGQQPTFGLPDIREWDKTSP